MLNKLKNILKNKGNDNDFKNQIISFLEGTSYNVSIEKITGDEVYLTFGPFPTSSKLRIINNKGSEQ